VVRSSDDLSEQQAEDFVKGQVAEHKQLAKSLSKSTQREVYLQHAVLT